MRLVFATTSAGKVREVSAYLGEGVVTTPADLGIVAVVPEDGATFRENALSKLAGWRALIPEGPLLAEDAGLEVAALASRPGVLSARYGPTEAEANERLLAEMAGEEDREARYVSVFALDDAEGAVVLWRAECPGQILTEPRGEGGFGYDPLFFHAGLGRSFAEVTLEEKATVSHRGQNLRRLAEWWRRWAPLRDALAEDTRDPEGVVRYRD